MKKKLFLLILIINLIVICTFIPKVSAARIDGEGTGLTCSFSNKLLGDDKWSVSVVLPSVLPEDGKVPGLKREELVKLVEKKYKEGIVESIKKSNGEEITDDEDYVGTGSIITLTTGREITVILYGDVNGNGRVNAVDALCILKHKIEIKKIEEDSEKIAANLVKNRKEEYIGVPSDDEIDLTDSVRISHYNVNLVGTSERIGLTIVDEELYPEDIEEIVDTDSIVRKSVETINEKENAQNRFTLNLSKNDEKDGYDNLLNCVVHDNNTKLGDIIGENTIFTELLNDEKVKEIIVKNGDKEYKIDKNSNLQQDILKFILNTDEDVLNYELKDLIDTELEVEIKIEDTAKFEGNQDGKYIVRFCGQVDLDDFVNKSIEDLEDNEYFTTTYNKDSNDITVKINNRSLKMNEAMENPNILKVLESLLDKKEIRSIVLNSESVDGLELDDSSEVKDKVLKWIKSNTKEILGRDNFDDAIAGDLSGKKISFTIKLKDNMKLLTGESEKTYNVKFIADPIKVTYDYGYAENGETENKKETVELENAGKLYVPDNPVREEIVTDELGNSETIKYRFLGWYELKDSVVSQVKFDFANVVYDDIVLVAKWNKIVDLDNLVNKAVEKVEKTDNLTTTFEKELSVITVLINNRSFKLNENISSFDMTQILKSLIESDDISSIVLKVDGIDDLVLSGDVDKLESRITSWFEQNSEKLFDRNDFNDAIAGDLSAKNISILINLNQNTELEDKNTNKTYTMSFVANPIKVTYDYGYIAQGETESKKYEMMVENASLVIEPKDPVRQETVTDSEGNTEIVNYRFLGWYVKNESNNSEVKFDFSKKVYDNIVLVAKWNKVVDLNNLVNKAVNNLQVNDYFNTTYSKESTDINVKINHRLPKLSEKIEDLNIIEILKYLTSQEDIQSITLNAEGVNEIKLSKNPEEIQNELVSWFSSNSKSLFGRDSFENVISGDLSGKTISMTIDLIDNSELDNQETKRAYNFLFRADSIKVTYDYGYKEEGKDENKTSEVILENSGLLEEPENPVREETLKDDDGNTKIVKYHFLGWYESDKKFDFNTEVLDNITLVAKWAKEVDLDSIVSKNVESVKENDYFNTEYSKGTNIINVKINHRSPKINEVISQFNIVEILQNLKSEEDIESITLSAEGVDGIVLTENLMEIVGWLNTNSLKLFGRNTFNDAIAGDLSGKTFIVNIKLKDGTELENGEKEKNYNVLFKADPIKVTYDYGYKEEGKDENKTSVETLENAGLLKEYDTPKRDGYRFLGWYKQEGENVSEQEFDFSATVYDNMTLVAKWIRVLDLDSLINKVVDNAEGNKEIDSTYQKDENKIIVKINNRLTKTNDALQNSDLIQILNDLIKEEDIEVVRLSAESVESININGTSEEILNWFNINSLKLLGKDNINDAIADDLVGKKFSIAIKINDDIELANQQKEKTYDILFVADPIEVTYDYDYKENGKNENKKATDILENVGLLEEPEIPVREEYRFLGWYKQDGEKFDFDNEIISDNITLIAKWIRVLDLDSLINNTLTNIGKGDDIYTTYEKESNQINVFINYRSPKLGANLQSIDTFKLIKQLGLYDDIDSITLKANDVEDIVLNGTESEIQNNLNKWFNSNTSKLFGIDNFDDVIIGDLADKTISMSVKINNDIELPNQQKEKTYKIVFKANPIVITYDYGYKEFGSTQNKKSTELLEESGVVTKPQDPVRNGYRFLGWYYWDTSLRDYKLFDFENTVIRDDFTLTAKWIEVLDIDNLVNDKLNDAKKDNIYTDDIYTSYTTGSNRLEVKINYRSTKIKEMISKIDVIKMIIELSQVDDIESITLSANNIDSVELTGNSSEVETKIRDWFTKNSSKLFGKNNFEDVLLGDLHNKTISMSIKVKDNIELNNQVKEKKYYILFEADPIIVTYDYGYENNNEEVMLEEPGLLKKKESLQRSGYKFLGWYYNGQLFDFDKFVVNDSITIYAKWVKIVDIDTDVKTVFDSMSKDSSITYAFNLTYSANERKLEMQATDGEMLFRELKNRGIISALVNDIELKDDRTVTIFYDKNSDGQQADTEIYKFAISNKTDMTNNITKLVNDLFGNSESANLSTLTGKTLEVTVKLDTEKSIQNDNSTERIYTINFVKPVTKDRVDPVGDIIKNNVINSNVYGIKNNGNNNIIITPKHSNDNLDSMSDTSLYKAIIKLIENKQIESVVMKYGENFTKSIDFKSDLQQKEILGVKNWFSANWTNICCCTDSCCNNGNCTWSTAKNNCLTDGTKFVFEIKLTNDAIFSSSGKNVETYNISFERDTVNVNFNIITSTTKKITIPVPEGLPIDESIFDKKQLLQYPEHEFKCWCTDIVCKNEYIFGKDPVTGNLNLYSAWYNIINTDKDIQEQIKSSSAGNSNIFNETYTVTSGTKNILFTIKNGTKDITDVLKTGTIIALNRELSAGYITQIEISYNNKSVFVTQANKDTVLSNVLSEISGKTIKLPLTSSAEDTSTISKLLTVTPVTIKVTYDSNKVKLNPNMTAVSNYTTTYKIAFDRVIKYNEMYDWGANIIKSRIDVNAKNGKISGRVDKSNIYINIHRCINTIAMNIIPGSGMKTALTDFLSNDCIKGIYIWETNNNTNRKYPSMNREQAAYLTAEDINLDDIWNLYNKFSDAFGGLEQIPLQRYLRYEVKIMVEIELADNCRMEDGKTLTYTISAEDVQVD